MVTVKRKFGDGKPGPGRPKGSKDKKWATLEYWFALTEADWQELTPKDRIAAVTEIIKLLIPRRTLPPQTPGDSVENADIILKELEREEGPIGPKPGSNQIRMEERTPQIQATAAAESGLRRDQGVTA